MEIIRYGTLRFIDKTGGPLPAKYYNVDLTGLVSQRVVVLLTDKNIVCGKWTIPLNTTSTDKLLKINYLL